MQLTRFKDLSLLGAFLLFFGQLSAQTPQGFFLDSWEPRNLTSPAYTNVEQTTKVVNVSVKINYEDTLTKVSNYLFGDNANAFTTSMSENKNLMKFINDRNLGVLRGPSGSISDYYFWNRYDDNPPSDIPEKLAGSTSAFSPWYGKRQSWATWAMDIDSFYSILNQVKATGMLTVNYGYARYGTSDNPVANAAHLAADWVRYDKGRTKFWEIGNEVFGNWEAGYRIDPALNKDGQPEYINGTLYGQHCLVFIDSMKSAAAQIGVDIKIGAVVVEDNSTSNGWNEALFSVVGDKIDFYSVHSYFTPYAENSSDATVLASSTKAATYKNYIVSGLKNQGKPLKPVALTEYNIFAVNSMQPVSHTNALHAVLVVGEAMKRGYGASLRWDLANGWDNGNDHGMFSFGSEPGVTQFSPRPAFYTLYYMRKYFGDVMLKDTALGNKSISVFSSRFNTGQASAILVNKGHYALTVRINIENFKYGDRYYTYTLSGSDDNGYFSRKTIINESGPVAVAGGPADYATILAKSSLVGNEIKVVVPALSMMVFIADKGEKELAIDETYYSLGTESKLPDQEVKVNLFPNPVRDDLNFEITGTEFTSMEITDVTGKLIFCKKGSFTGTGSIYLDLPKGVYLVKFRNDKKDYTSRMVVD